MVKLNKIYTRTGDKGTTALVRGERRRKDDIRVCAYGTVDEANAFVGQCRLNALNMARLDAILSHIQNDLFDLGSDLATPGSDENQDFPSLRVSTDQIDWLEHQIDQANADLEPLSSFVLPAGSPLASSLHVARTVVRRAEREVVSLLALEPETGKNPLIYLNRLSDLLFVLSRLANKNAGVEILWQPGRHLGAGKASK
ncbi:ATP:Cob(I)alamin adenosyltransferase [hydrothermal vent metagenome]|uniref:ATP:Cob(I)alamin adenosyltransferase n=1 Tax=hydrothermal vent metagenome TaxID=652676 RepID=A0A3B0TRM3_9ZZZZ